MGRSHRTISLPFPQKKKKKVAYFGQCVLEGELGFCNTNAVRDSDVSRDLSSRNGGRSPSRGPALLSDKQEGEWRR